MNDEKKYALNLLKTARGQMDAVIRMLEEDRYCVDVSNQILAVQGLLKKSNMAILKQHMEHCVKDAFLAGGGDEKVEEVMELFNKLS